MGGHELWRESLCLLLSRMFPNAVIFEAADETDPVFRTSIVNLIVFCLSPPYLKGLGQLLVLRRHFSLTPVVMISDVQDNLADTVVRTHNANAFLRSSASADDIFATIAGILGGRQIYPQPSQGKKKVAAFPLSSRQMEVFSLLCKGMTNKEIGIVLSLSNNTVRTHVSAIFDMLGVRNRTEAATIGNQLI